MGIRERRETTGKGEGKKNTNVQGEGGVQVTAYEI